MSRVIEGVMVVKDGKGWGEIYSDGRETVYGWMNINEAPIHNSKRCKKTTSVTYPGSHYIGELKTAKLMRVKRTIATELLGE